MDTSDQFICIPTVPAAGPHYSKLAVEVCPICYNAAVPPPQIPLDPPSAPPGSSRNELSTSDGQCHEMSGIDLPPLPAPRYRLTAVFQYGMVWYTQIYTAHRHKSLLANIINQLINQVQGEPKYGEKSLRGKAKI